MITLVGVGHVFRIRANVAAIIEDRMPHVVAVELDEDRLWALEHPVEHERMISQQPFIYQLMSKLQREIARSYGAEAGEEMVSAVRTGKRIFARVELIDTTAQLVLNDLFRKMSFRERALFFGGIAGAVFGGAFGGLLGRTLARAAGRRAGTIEDELKKMEADSEAYMRTLEREFPTIKRELIDSRDAAMSRRLAALDGPHRRVLAVVGDGHVPGMSRILGGRELEILRLSQVRSYKRARPAPGPLSTAGWSFTWSR